mgnify:CR=1 FL=1
MVWVTEDEFSSMNSERIAKFKAECDTIYAGIETPGDYEDFLAGDWTEHTASLQPYAGKNIYIAFVNSNGKPKLCIRRQPFGETRPTVPNQRDHRPNGGKSQRDKNQWTNQNHDTRPHLLDLGTDLERFSGKHGRPN